MSLINVSNLTFAYDGSYDNIFENVSFSIDTDWKLGFVGRNGRGKTTFLKLLMGSYSYSGNISASVRFEYFPYEVEDTTELTAEIISQIAVQCEQWRVNKELNLLGVDTEVLYRPFCTLSNGEQTKVLLAALFLRENNFLLIDEPTNHLDTEARELVADYLSSKSGFILVSHDRAFLDKCADHIISMNKTNIEVQRGNFSSWYANKEAQDNLELAENERLKHDVKRLSEAAKRTAEWSNRAESRKIGFDPVKTEKSMSRRAVEGAKAKKMMSRAKTLQDRQQTAIDEKRELLKNIETAESLKLSPLVFHAQRLAELKDISVAYGENTVCEGISFDVCRGDRVCLEGKNGSGKSSLLKLVLGENIPHTGQLLLGSGLKISYVSQDTSHLAGDLKSYAEHCGIDESLFKAILRKLDFSRIQFEKDMHDYSGGQKKKVLLARSLCEQAHLYIWDEPLNFIDVFSRMQIEGLLMSFKPTLLFVEHDAAFRKKITTKTVTL